MTTAEPGEGRAAVTSGGKVASGLLSAVTSNLLFMALFAAGAVVRVLVLSAYKPALLLQRDTYIYLAYAFADKPSGFRPILYSLLLRPLLAAGDLAIVPVVQHLAGLAISLMLFLALRRAGVGPNLAALGVAPVLLDGYQLIIEQYLLTETLFQLLVAAGITLLVWSRRPPVGAVAVAGILLSLAGLTRFVGVVLIVPALIYVLWRRMGLARFGVLLVAFALPLGSYALWFKTTSGSAGVTNKNGFFLFGRVVDFSDCTGIDIPPPERPLCRVEPPEPGDPTGVFALDLPGRIERSPRANALLQSFSRRMILERPGDYAATIAADLRRYFESRPPLSQEPNVVRWRFPRTLADADPKRLILKNNGGAPPRYGLDTSFTIDRPLAEWLRSYQEIVYSYGPLLGALLLLGAAGAVVGLPAASGTGAGPRRNLRAECVLFVLAGVALLLGPVMAAVYHFRYVIASLPLIGPAGAAGAAALWGRLGGTKKQAWGRLGGTTRQAWGRLRSRRRTPPK